ncbi:MAG: hypothetical protein KDA32_12165 [Phycisphaerales bacterium]|nr:hypothetical protein [Phycisphaerales bacterium]
MGWLWGGFWNNAMPYGAHSAANSEAHSWHIVLQLRALFETRPELIEALIESDANENRTYSTDLVMSAAYEAIAARPEDVRIRYHAAAAALKLGRNEEARALLERPEKKPAQATPAATGPGNASEVKFMPTNKQKPATPGRAQSPADTRAPRDATQADHTTRPPG